MMFRLTLFIAGLVLSCPQMLCASGVIEQELVVHLHPESSRLVADATVKLADPEDAWPEFLLAAHAKIETLQIDGEEMTPVFENGRLSLASTPSKATVEVRYSIIYDDPVPDDFVGIEDPTYGVTATIKPEGVYLASSSHWHLYPQGRQQNLAISVVGNGLMTGVTSGYLQSYCRTPEETVTSWQLSRQQTSLTLAAGHYFLERESLGDIQLLTFLTDKNQSLGEGYLSSVRDYLELYQERLGPYPYKKFAVVENFFPTGYGLPGWTLLGSSVVRLPFIRTTSLPHEIAHAWWGNSVDVDTRNGNWAEGLATYLADYYLKEVKSADEALQYRRKLLRDYAALAAGGDYPLKSFVRRASKVDQSIGYGKAAMTFHMLRELIGDEAFWAALQDAAMAGQGKAYSWNDLQRHFEKASGDDLQAFFAQWVERAGAPTLEVTDIDITESDNGWQVSGTLRQSEPVYQLAVPLRLVAEGQVYEQVVGLTQKEDCFLFTVSKSPVSLVVDPDNTLFRHLYPAEVPATINSLRATKKPLVVVAEGAGPLLEASRNLMSGLQWHNTVIKTEKEYLQKTTPDKDVLFLGRPKNASLQKEIDEALAIMQDHSTESADSQTVFLVKKAAIEGRVVAYFLPDSADSARNTARRIPHYGQYSYLLFENGANRVKATWETTDSRLTASFTKEGSR